MVFLKLDSVRSLARVLVSNPQAAEACGLKETVPSYRTLTRRFKALEHPVIEFARQVVEVLIKHRLISLKVISTDSSLIGAKGKVSQKKNSKVNPSDPDARWGWSASRGWVFGYKLHLTSSVMVKDRKDKSKIKKTLVPLVWQVSSANHHDTKFLLSLMNKTLPLAKESQTVIDYSLAPDLRKIK